MRIGTEKEAIESLFHAGGTIDIIVRKVTKNTVKVTYCNENFTYNKWGVLCCESVMDDGRIWYSFCPSRFPEKEITLAIREYTGR